MLVALLATNVLSQIITYRIAGAVISAQAIGSVDPTDIGKAFGLMQSVQLLGTVIMPIVSTTVTEDFSYPLMCYSCAAFSAAGIVIARLPSV